MLLVEIFALPGGRENYSRDEIQEGRQRRRDRGEKLSREIGERQREIQRENTEGVTEGRGRRRNGGKGTRGLQM